MALFENSRHLLVNGRFTDQGQSFIEDRIPFRFRQKNDNILHAVKSGDTLFTLASTFYRSLVRPAGLWWVIADYQTPPIHDPTIVLQEGRVLIIPSLRTVQEEVFDERRRTESLSSDIAQRSRGT